MVYSDHHSSEETLVARSSFFKSFVIATAAIAVVAVSPVAEAKRLGGGKSYGMQRQATPSAPAQAPGAAPAPTAPQRAPSQATPAQPAPAAAAAQPKRNWLGPIAGLAAGLGIAALLSHFGMGEGMANFLMIALLVMAAVFVFRLIFSRRTAPARSEQPLQYAGVGGPSYAPAPDVNLPGGSADAAAAPAAAAAESPRVPAGFDAAGFLDVAKRNFVRLQAANDAGHIDEIRDFLTPEMFTVVNAQLAERGGASQTTDVVQLNASLLEVADEGSRYIASVRYYGLLREEKDAPPTSFDEIWHLVKPAGSDGGWRVAGIQQLD